MVMGIADDLLGSLFDEAKTNVKAHTARVAKAHGPGGDGNAKAKRAKNIKSYVDWDPGKGKASPKSKGGSSSKKKSYNSSWGKANTLANMTERMADKARPFTGAKSGWHDSHKGEGFNTIPNLLDRLDDSGYTTKEFNRSVGYGVRTPVDAFRAIFDRDDWKRNQKSGVLNNRAQKWGDTVSGIDSDKQWADSGDDIAFEVGTGLGLLKGPTMAARGIRGIKRSRQGKIDKALDARALPAPVNPLQITEKASPWSHGVDSWRNMGRAFDDRVDMGPSSPWSMPQQAPVRQHASHGDLVRTQTTSAEREAQKLLDQGRRSAAAGRGHRKRRQKQETMEQLSQQHGIESMDELAAAIQALAKFGS